MPREVTMPQLGMAQDSGLLVAWLKRPGEAVAKGEPLFEVETDKATMEIEAPADGYLTGIAAAAGEDVPVGAVIAQIAESPEAAASAPASNTAAPEGALPEGRTVTMPQLGMAQDSGVLVSWQKAAGEAVAATDVLFEVETDKSTMEVEAGHAGFLAATLAAPGEEVAVGAALAIISAEKPQNTVTRNAGDAPQATSPARTEERPAPAKVSKPATSPARAEERPAASGRILASPKARRIARAEGLDLARLVATGHPQPYHVADLDVLRALPPVSAAPTLATGAASRRLTAQIARDGLRDFCAWAAEAHGLGDADALLAGLAASALTSPGAVAVERHGQARAFALAEGRSLSQVAETDAPPALILRDLRSGPITDVALGPEAQPVITLTTAADGEGLTLTLECSPSHLDAAAAIELLGNVAGRIEDPLRHLL